MINNNERALGLLGLCAKSGNAVSGTDACIEAINKNKVKLIIVASDASDRTKNNFKYLSSKSNIPICIFETIEKISKSIGKKNKAVIGIKNDSLAGEINKIINGGDVIG